MRYSDHPENRRRSSILLQDGDAIILVHGTFARAASWISSDSIFNTHIANLDLNNVQSFPFRWSGENSHIARSQGGSELSELIQNIRKERNITRFHLITHSHGGNVAIYALRDPVTAGYVKSIVFLGTPFLELKARLIEPWIRFYAHVLTWLCICVTCTLLLATLDLRQVIEHPHEMIKAFGAGFAIGTPIYILIGEVRIWAGDCCVAKWMPRIKNAQELLRAQFWLAPPLQPVCIATVARDEARLYLRTLDYISSIAWQFFDFLIDSRYWILLCYFYFHIGNFQKPPMQIIEDPALIQLLLILLTVALGLPLLATPISMLFRGSMYGFGEKGPTFHLLLSVVPSQYPAWQCAHGSRRFSLGLSYKARKRHSRFYSDVEMIMNVIGWLRTPLTHIEYPKIRPSSSKEDLNLKDFRSPIISSILGFMLAEFLETGGPSTVPGCILVSLSILFWALARATKDSMKFRNQNDADGETGRMY